jgi:hypothetical protein
MSGTWGKWHGSWVRPDAGGHEAVDEATDGDDPAALARWLAARDFWLVDEGLDSQDGGKAALVLDVEGIPVVAAFTSQKHVSSYAQDQSELFADPQNIPAFLAAGRDVVLTIPAGGGMVIDPSTDEELYLPPELIERIRVELSR